MKQKYKILTISSLVFLAGSSIYGINKFINSSALRKNFLGLDSGSHFYNWRFGKIYYEKTGSGSPLLLIHDLAPYASSFQWNQLVSKLSKNHTVYTIDLLGCGRSDHPNITYTNFLYVQLICDFIEEIIKEKTNIIASKFASSFAITACNIHSALFNKLILINPEDFSTLNQLPTPSTKIRKLLLELPLIGNLVYNMINSKNSIELLFTEKFYNNPFHVNQKEVDVWYESAHKNNGNGRYLLASLVGNYMNFNIIHSLKSINNSIYIICGNNKENQDNIVHQYTGLNPAIESSAIKDTKEFPELENPSTLLDYISLYLNS